MTEVSGPVSVVGLGAFCQLRGRSEDGHSVSFSVSEFAALEDGRRLVLHQDRGYTTSWGSGVSGVPGISESLTREAVTQDVLNVVLPDDDGEDHPWDWLASLARARGARVTADELRGLPYDVVLADSVLRLLPPDQSRKA